MTQPERGLWRKQNNINQGASVRVGLDHNCLNKKSPHLTCTCSKTFVALLWCFSRTGQIKRKEKKSQTNRGIDTRSERASPSFQLPECTRKSKAFGTKRRSTTFDERAKQNVSSEGMFQASSWLYISSCVCVCARVYICVFACTLAPHNAQANRSANT